MLVKSLVVSSHGFSLSFHFVLEILSKITNILSSMFPTSLCFTVLLFSFFVFFSFHSFKHWRTFNIHVNQLVKLLSPFILVDSTRFSLYALTEVSKKSNHTQFNSWFQNIHFSYAIPRSPTLDEWIHRKKIKCLFGVGLATPDEP